VKFGREFANRIGLRAPRCGDKWHLDEVVITIAGKKHWLCRAVDQEALAADRANVLKPWPTARE
jgi:putative transposase